LNDLEIVLASASSSSAPFGWPKRADKDATIRTALYQSAFSSTGIPARCVITQSPTFASIQVSCTPGSPARSNPSTGSTPMP